MSRPCLEFTRPVGKTIDDADAKKEKRLPLSLPCENGVRVPKSDSGAKSAKVQETDHAAGAVRPTLWPRYSMLLPSVPVRQSMSHHVHSTTFTLVWWRAFVFIVRSSMTVICHRNEAAASIFGCNGRSHSALLCCDQAVYHVHCPHEGSQFLF